MVLSYHHSTTLRNCKKKRANTVRPYDVYRILFVGATCGRPLGCSV